MTVLRACGTLKALRAVCGVALAVVASPAGAAALNHMPFTERFSTLLFGEADYVETQLNNPDGLNFGQVVAQITARVTDRMMVFSEMTATARKNQGEDFEVERFIIGYDFSDQFKLSVGRYHTPLGYWNAAFHHGSWLQTTVSRPQTVKFGSYVIPIHFVGALLEGKVGESDFGYRVGVGNGRSKEINDPRELVGDNDNGELAGLLTANYRPSGRLLDTGVSVFVDRVDPDDGPEVNEVIASAYGALQGETPEVIVAYTYSNHERREGSGPDGSLHSIYGQFAYRLPGRADHFKPYVRAERLDVDDDDPLLGNRGLDYDGVSAGVRWDFARFAALKAEVRREQFNKGSDDASFWLQFSFVFDVNHRLMMNQSLPESTLDNPAFEIRQ